MSHEDTGKFVIALYGRYFAKHDGYIELRFISNPSKKSPAFSKFLRYDEFDESVLEEIRKLNTEYNIYFGVNPRPISKGKKEPDVKNIVCFWADADSKDFKNGKEEALKIIKEFPNVPNIIVDSGHGYHCYWLLEKPIIDIGKEARIQFKQILSGIVEKLNADKHPMFLNCLLRLPGTLNIKKEEPKECKIIFFKTDKRYTFEDFEEFKNAKYKEPKPASESTFDFGEKELIVSAENLEIAKSNVDQLEVDLLTKKRIITGTNLTKKDADKTRSGRDLSIIYSLVRSGYNYPTIKSIFFNPHLGCSDRIAEKGESGEPTLRWAVQKALEFIKKRESNLTPEEKEIRLIKMMKKTSREEKLRLMTAFITESLISGDKPSGRAYKETDRKIYYYFDEKEKMLIDAEGMDFYYFTRIRFGIQSNDYKEIRDAIITEIWKNGKEIESHKFAYFDKKKFILYISDHDNGVYRLNGKKIELVDNGTDGVFFETNSDFTPFNVDIENLEAINYFERERETKLKLKNIGTLNLRKRKNFGFILSDFAQGDSYLRRYLIDIANFAETEKNITPIEQKILLVIYFYSLFFESIMTEKPIICFVGLKDSGKSTIGSLIGKILFGDKFQCRNCPEDIRDMQTIIGENYFMVLDNVDRLVKNEMIDILCETATGIVFEKRKLFTDREIVKIKPHIWLGITTREAKFKRDDLISRLLLFNTEKITRRIQKEKFYRDVEENRNKIMTEVLVNLNSIIVLLKKQKHYHPVCTFRVADWETFGRKVTAIPFMGTYFKLILEVMNKEKDIFALEDDPIFFLLKKHVIDDKRAIEEHTAADLFVLLQDIAENLKMKNLGWKRYNSPVSVGKRINNVIDELGRVFDIKIRTGSHNVALYSFDRLEETKIEHKEQDVVLVKEKIEEEKMTPEGLLRTEKIKKSLAKIRAKHSTSNGKPRETEETRDIDDMSKEELSLHIAEIKAEIKTKIKREKEKTEKV